MHAFHQILFPVDFSAPCVRTVPFVKEMVRANAASLTLLHVVEIPAYWYAAMSPEAPVAWNDFPAIEREAQERLSAFGCEHFSDLAKITHVEALCDRGDPGYAIAAHAEKREPDLIMMPSHGHGPFRTFLLGSTTSRVLHRAACPVWTGAHLGTEAIPSGTAAHARIRNILCAVDLERESRHVLDAAVTLSQMHDAPVRLVHAIPVPECGPAAEFVSEFDRFLADSAREKMLDLQREAGVEFEVCMQGGPVSAVVRDTALARNADIVVIGRGHTHAPLSRLRSNAWSIIRESPCPVLSV